MPSWDELLGSGSVAEQLLVWGVVNQLIGDLFSPFLELVRDKVNAANPVVPLSPADLADMVVRGIKTEGDAAAEAAASGINAERFHELYLDTGEPPGLEQVLELFRRKVIGWGDAGVEVPSVERGIRTGRLYNYWADALRKAYDPSLPGGGTALSVGEAVNAALRQQAPLAQMAEEASLSGLNAERFQILLDSAGRPPSPTELMEMVRRNKIPMHGKGPGVLSLEQGIFEGDAKDKWEPIYEALVEYWPPPRIVTTLLRTGAIDEAKAQTYFQGAGLTPELAAAYERSITGEKLEGTRQLAQGTVLELYEAEAIDTATATELLTVLGYTKSQAELVLELTDIKRENAALNRAISRVGTLYTSHRITRAAAVETLKELGVTGAHQARQMQTWDQLALAEVKLPTIAEIGQALKYGAVTEDEAMTEALKLGYQPFDAYIALSAHAGGPLSTKPPIGPVGPGVI